MYRRQDGLGPVTDYSGLRIAVWDASQPAIEAVSQYEAEVRSIVEKFASAGSLYPLTPHLWRKMCDEGQEATIGSIPEPGDDHAYFYTVPAYVP